MLLKRPPTGIIDEVFLNKYRIKSHLREILCLGHKDFSREGGSLKTVICSITRYDWAIFSSCIGKRYCWGLSPMHRQTLIANKIEAFEGIFNIMALRLVASLVWLNQRYGQRRPQHHQYLHRNLR